MLVTSPFIVGLELAHWFHLQNLQWPFAIQLLTFVEWSALPHTCYRYG